MSTQPFNMPGAAVHADALVAAWPDKAVGDLQVAQRLLDSGDHRAFDAVCFHAQQGAEKLIKAALTAHGAPFPKVHDLVHLDARLRRVIVAWSFDINALSELSTMAVESRYPGFRATEQEAGDAFDTASRLSAALRPLV